MTGPDRTRAAARRAWCVRASAAAWGLALAAATASALQRPAPPGQLPGAMTAAGLDAAGPFLQLAALILVPVAAALAGAQLARHLAGAPRWMPATFCIALASAPLTLLAGGGLAAVLLHGAAAAAALGARWVPSRREAGGGRAPANAGRAPADAGRPPGDAGRAPGDAGPAPGGRHGAPPAPRRDRRSGFSRCDLLLIPSVLICYFAILDLAPAGTRPVTSFLAAAVLTLGLRAAAGRISSLRRPGLALAPVPLAVLLQLRWLPAGAAAIAALAWIAAAPLAVALLLRTPAAERRLPLTLTATVPSGLRITMLPLAPLFQSA